MIKDFDDTTLADLCGTLPKQDPFEDDWEAQMERMAQWWDDNGMPWALVA